jgi:hypothetical protein
MRRLAMAFVVVLGIFPSLAWGQIDYHWDVNGATAGTGGTGTWLTANAWRSGSSTGTLGDWANNNNAVFGGTAGAITTSSGVTARSLTFSQTGYTISGSSVLALSGGAPTITVNSGVVATLGTTAATPTAIVSFTGGLTVAGGGELRLAGAVSNTSTGGITVNSSTLTVGNPTVATNAANAPRQNLGGQALTLNDSTLVVATQNSLFTSTFQAASISSTGSSTINIFRTGTANSTGLSVTTDGASSSTNYSALTVQGSLQITGGGNNNSTGSVAVFGATALTGTTTFSTVAGLVTPGGSVTTVLSLGGNSGSSSGALVGVVTDSGNAMTFLGGGTSTTQGGQLRIGGVGNNLTGTLTVGNADGTGAGSVFLGGGSSSLTSGNVTVNSFSQLLINNTLAGGSTTYGTASQSITLNGIGNQTAGGSGSSGALRFDVYSGAPTAAYSNTIQSAIVLNSDTVISVAGAAVSGVSNSATLSGGVSGSGGLQKQGQGNLVLSTSSTYSGATSVGNGAIIVNSTGSLGTGSLTLAQTSTNTTAVTLNNATQTISSLSSSWTATGGTIAQTLTLNGTVLTVDQSTNTTFGQGTVNTLTSIITGNGSVTKLGVGTLTLTNANTYSGGTTVSGGTLVAANTTGSATGTAGITVSGTGVLAGGTGTGSVGRVTGLTDVQTGGTIRADSGSGTNTLTVGNVTIQNGGKLVTNIGGTGSDSTLAFAANILDLKTGSILQLDDVSGFSVTTAGTYRVATFTNGDSIQLNAVGSQADGFLFGAYEQGVGATGAVTIDVSSLPTLAAGDKLELRRSGNDLVLTFTPVPEPTTILGVAVGLVAVGGFIRKRLAKKATVAA